MNIEGKSDNMIFHLIMFKTNISSYAYEYLLVFSLVEVLKLHDVGVTGTSIENLNFLMNSSSGIAVVPGVLLDNLEKSR